MNTTMIVYVDGRINAIIVTYQGDFRVVTGNEVLRFATIEDAIVRAMEVR